MVIADCGELAEGEDDGVPELNQDGDHFEDYPEDQGEEIQTSPQLCQKIATELKELGGQLFKAGKQSAALEKFESKDSRGTPHICRSLTEVF